MGTGQFDVLAVTEQSRFSKDLVVVSTFIHRAFALLELGYLAELKLLIPQLESVEEPLTQASVALLKTRLLPVHQQAEFLKSRQLAWGKSCAEYYCSLLIREGRYSELDNVSEDIISRFPEITHVVKYNLAFGRWITGKTSSNFELLVAATFNTDVSYESALLYTADRIINKNRLEESGRLVDRVLRYNSYSKQALKLKGWLLFFEKDFKSWWMNLKNFRRLRSRSEQVRSLKVHPQ